MILLQAVRYIRELVEREGKNTELWTYEKLLSDRIQAEMQMQIERLGAEVERLRRENLIWKQAAGNIDLVSSTSHLQEDLQHNSSDSKILSVSKE